LPIVLTSIGVSPCGAVVFATKLNALTVESPPSATSTPPFENSPKYLLDPHNTTRLPFKHCRFDPWFWPKTPIAFPEHGRLHGRDAQWLANVENNIGRRVIAGSVADVKTHDSLRLTQTAAQCQQIRLLHLENKCMENLRWPNDLQLARLLDYLALPASIVHKACESWFLRTPNVSA
jgi:hypothetical protein